MFVQKLGLHKKRKKKKIVTGHGEVSCPPSQLPHTASPALLSPAVVHNVSANPSIADYPQMARLRGTIKEKVVSNAHRNQQEQELFTLYWIARKRATSLMPLYSTVTNNG